MQSTDEVRQALDRIWERPEFIERSPTLMERGLALVAEQFNRFMAWIGERFPELDGLAESVGVVGEILLFTLLVAGILGVGWLLYRVISTLGGTGAGDAVARPLREARDTDPNHWEALAREAAASGRYREAALARYRALLLRLARGERIRLRDGRTPGDYLRELARPAAETAPAFRAFLGHFHPVAFGSAAPRASAWEALAAAAARVEGTIAPAGDGAGRGTGAATSSASAELDASEVGAEVEVRPEDTR